MHFTYLLACTLGLSSFTLAYTSDYESALCAREYNDILETREFEDMLRARDYEDLLEAREYEDMLYARDLEEFENEFFRREAEPVHYIHAGGSIYGGGSGGTGAGGKPVYGPKPGDLGS